MLGVNTSSSIAPKKYPVLTPPAASCRKHIISYLGNMLSSLLHLLYPHSCETCGNDLSRSEEVLCMLCARQLPATGFQHIPGNPVEKIFTGRVAFQHATAGYYFRQQSRLQQLVHQFKYHGRKDIALYLGRQLGLQLQQSPWWQQVTTIIPVPLNTAKQRHRGYNQAAMLAAGIAGVLGCSMLDNALERVPNSSTQTRKSRMERWENVSSAFTLKDPNAINDQHILLIDDVVTTGATMEACAHAVGAATEKVSICTLAYASK